MNYEKLFPGRFIKSADFDGKDVNLVIVAVRAEDIEDKPKAVMTFEHTKKEMVLCRTNAEALKLMWGPETNNWVGKRVTLFPAVIKDPFGDGEITAIRVRGSPDLKEPASATIQRGRKTIKVAVRPTGPQQKQAPPKNGSKPKGRVIDVPPGMSEEEAASIYAAEQGQTERIPGED